MAPRAVNIARALASFDEPWSPKVIGDVNDCQIKAVKLDGEFVWHKHDAEDEAFLRDMPAVLGARAMNALEHIRDRLALDYAGIDFGLDDQGNVLFFEANASMTIHPPAADERWEFRRAPVARILDAARRMLVERAAAGV